jgi:hypothetical protein
MSRLCDLDYLCQIHDGCHAAVGNVNLPACGARDDGRDGRGHNLAGLEPDFDG